MNASQGAVLVTGATAGTGLCIARRFAREGYSVVITSRRETDALEAAAQIAREYDCFAFGVKLDPAEGEKGVADAMERIEKQNRPLNSLVLNAANLGIGMDVLTVPVAEWQEVIQTNVVWNFTIAQQAAKRMALRKQGSILFIGSNTSRRAIPQRSAYVASKGALNALARAMAVDLGDYGIRCNCLLAGPIATARWDNLSADQQNARISDIPLKRIARFEDIAEAAYFLSSEAAATITGAELVIDGGLDAYLSLT